MAKKLIIISGKQFSGKDTLAKFLLEFLPDFKRIGLGDAIKLEYGKKHNLTFEEIENNKSQYRSDLIALGDWGRAQNPDYWLQRIIDTDANIIVPDIRMPHELEIFKQHKAIAIRVESPRANREKRGILVKENDPTETLLDNQTNWDFIVQNDSTLDALRDKAMAIAKHCQ